MVSAVKAVDVAASILHLSGFVTTMKLQKMVFYAQVEHLHLLEVPFFTDRIEAWIHGPVIPELFQHHRGKFLLNSTDLDHVGDSKKLSVQQREIVKSISGKFADWTGEDLRERVHSEKPWKNARRGLLPREPGSIENTKDAIREFYSHGVVRREA